MTRKSGLGRGLDALISETDRPIPGVINQIPVGRILPNPRQPRSNIDREALVELSESIKTHGILQPLIVTYDDQKDRYTLVAGGRGLLAAELAGLETVPAIVREASEQQRLELALIENIQRADLNPLEAAEAYRRLVDEFGLSHEDVAGQVGKNRATVTNTMRLLKLPDAVKTALTENRISEGHARALLALSTPQAQIAALNSILTRDLNVRQTEELVKKLIGKTPRSLAKTENPDPEINDLEGRLRSRLGTKVRLTRRNKGGTLLIYFYSDEEFNALIENILGTET